MRVLGRVTTDRGRPARSDLGRVLYWFVVGGMLGVGVIAILSIGALFLLAGLLLLLFGGRAFGFRGAWTVVVGLGLVPAAVLAHDVLTAPPPCVGPIQPGQACQEIPAAYSVMAIAFGVIALCGLLYPLLRGHERLALGAAIASGIATIVWSAQHAVAAISVGERCRGSSATGMHCTSIMSPSLLSHGDYRAIAVSLGVGIVVAILIVGFAVVHVRFHQLPGLVGLWVMAALLLYSGIINATIIAAAPGILAVVAGLAASGQGEVRDAPQPPEQGLFRQSAVDT